MKRLNDISGNLYSRHSATGTRNGKGLFMTELIDIITPAVPQKNRHCPGSGPSSGGANSAETYASSDIDNKFASADLNGQKKKRFESVNLIQICLVMSLMDSDLDQLLKHRIEFSEQHLVRIVYNTLSSI